LGVKLLNLLHLNEFEFSAPQFITPVENGEVLDIVMQKNVWLTEVIVCDILDSDHLTVIFHLLDHIRAGNLLDLVDKFTDWSSFKAWHLN
jgi:hypothetical protein